MTTRDANAVEKEVRIAARPETVLSFFTDQDRLLRWMGMSGSLDIRPGGAFRLVINDENIAGGAFVAIEPPHRLVMTWGWEGAGNPMPPGSTTVEVTLTADGDGTLLRLVHRDLPAAAMHDHLAGWEHYLARLAIVAAGGDAGPDGHMSGEPLR
ncbi:MAG: SRPBCC family protein [Dehalococcoidia bacterium]